MIVVRAGAAVALENMSTYTLLFAFAINGPQRLRAQFGASAAAAALGELGEAMPALAARVLAGHLCVESHRDDAQGRWYGRFRPGAGELPRDPAERCASAMVAAGKLTHELMLRIFGGGSGRQLDFALVVTPCEEDGGERWSARAEAALAAGAEAARVDPVEVAEVRRIFASGALRTLLQPIVRLADRRVVGYEALTRGPPGSPLERPDRLFDAAHAAGLAVQMELLCAELALARTCGRIPEGQFLAINLGPAALAQAPARLALGGRREVVIELTEHLPLDEAEALAAAIRALHEAGGALALDDTGCGYADLDSARALRPQIVKLCITVIRNAGRSAQQLEEIRRTTAELHALGCRVLAEGVETESQHAALASCGMELAQGWLYGRPQPLEAVLQSP